MKEIYAWVPWFRELAGTVAAGTQDELSGRARQIRWSDNPEASIGLLEQGQDVDPFSFLYTLASRCGGPASRERVCNDVTELFGLAARIPVESDDAFIFPRGQPNNANYRTRGQDELDLLWRLFRGAVEGPDSVLASDFEVAHGIPGVGTSSLTQVLFLANPDAFLPYDGRTKPLMTDPLTRPDWSTLRQGTEQLRSRFPGCDPWEINLFAYLIGATKLKVGPSAFQVSTNVYNDGRDFWDDFQENNWVYTGGRDSGVSWDDYVDDDSTRGKVTYPLDVPDEGDLMLVRNAGEAKGIGVVYRNDYRESLTRESRLHVIWLNKVPGQLGGGVALGRGFSGAIEYAEAFRRVDAYAPTFEIVDELTEGQHEPTPAPLAPDPADAVSAHTSTHPRNQILYGPPGTGKTWQTVNLALAIVDGTAEADHDLQRYHELHASGQIAAATFHQNFAYEDFIEGIRPVLGDAGAVRYALRDGLFKTMAQRAREAPDKPFVLIIDEINRGNVARIFGELITLIEESRRAGEAEETVVTLPYSGEDFSVPGNLYLIGTMNTADRSIELLDTALRRRFVFRELMPETDHPLLLRDVGGVDCRRLLHAINERIALLLDREHQIGHTYLLDVGSLDDLGRRFRERVFPLLQEYFFDDWSKIRAVLGRNCPFVASSAPELSAELADLVDEEQRIWRRLPDSDWRWVSADAYRAIYAADADANRV